MKREEKRTFKNAMLKLKEHLDSRFEKYVSLSTGPYPSYCIINFVLDKLARIRYFGWRIWFWGLRRIIIEQLGLLLLGVLCFNSLVQIVVAIFKICQNRVHKKKTKNFTRDTELLNFISFEMCKLFKQRIFMYVYMCWYILYTHMYIRR